MSLELRERLKVIGLPLVAPVKSILLGTDAIWKYWVIYSLLNKVSNETLCLLKNELENIAYNPSNADIIEEVNVVASEILVKCQ